MQLQVGPQEVLQFLELPTFGKLMEVKVDHRRVAGVAGSPEQFLKGDGRGWRGIWPLNRITQQGPGARPEGLRWTRGFTSPDPERGSTEHDLGDKTTKRFSPAEGPEVRLRRKTARLWLCGSVTLPRGSSGQPRAWQGHHLPQGSLEGACGEGRLCSAGPAVPSAPGPGAVKQVAELIIQLPLPW